MIDTSAGSPAARYIAKWNAWLAATAAATSGALLRHSLRKAASWRRMATRSAAVRACAARSAAKPSITMRIVVSS